MRDSVKTTIKVFVLLCVAAVALGFSWAHYQAKETEFEIVPRHEFVHEGDTFDGIVKEYYNPYNEKECWDEWKTNQKNRNKRLFFYENGKPRVLKPGDVVCIEVRERVK